MGQINRQNGHCMACLKDDQQVRYIDLYVIGSEGLTICHPCEMELVRKVGEMRHAASVAKRDAFIAANPHIQERIARNREMKTDG
jgi:hypothetical protein